MSDESMQGPTLPRGYLQQKRDRLVAEADAWERRDLAEFLDSVRALADENIRRFTQTKCGGELARVQECSDANASVCEQRDHVSCPRRIRAYDAARDSAALSERLGDSGIPLGLQNVVISDLRPSDATLAVDAWLETSQTLLLLAGGVGVGKSVAAAYAIRRTPGRWFSAPDMGQLQGFDGVAQLAALRRPRLLVIDDLGAEYSDRNEWARTQLRTLICQRHDEGTRTLVTTNLNAAQWKAYADERLLDRLATGTVKTIGGPSMRRKP